MDYLHTMKNAPLASRGKKLPWNSPLETGGDLFLNELFLRSCSRWECEELLEMRLACFSLTSLLVVKSGQEFLQGILVFNFGCTAKQVLCTSALLRK